MFRNENPDFLNILHKQQENHAEIVKQFAAMGKTISDLKDSMNKSTSEIVILQPYEQTFAAQGYKFNSLYVSDAAANDNCKLIVSLNGVTYTTVLAAGENAVNIPDQATYKATTTSGNAPGVILTRYNTPNIDNNVTVIGGVKLQGGDSGGTPYSQAIGGDGYSGQSSLWTYGFNEAYNGSTWDRMRNNTSGTLLASSPRSATTNSPIQTNYNARGVILFLNCSATSGTGGIHIVIKSSDPTSGAAPWMAPESGAVTAIGNTMYAIYPGIPTGGAIAGTGFSQTTNMALPRTWYASVYHDDASSYTYSLGYQYIL